ncbi:MAG TPA: hypothetical protein VN112_08540 [Ensifer sp.]|nr:hypothetical protein [Ensifer sp.]
MPKMQVNAGAAAAIPADIVAGAIEIYGINASYTIAINGGPAFGPLNVISGPPDVFHINRNDVTITNTSPAGAGPNMLLVW